MFIPPEIWGYIYKFLTTKRILYEHVGDLHELENHFRKDIILDELKRTILYKWRNYISDECFSFQNNKVNISFLIYHRNYKHMLNSVRRKSVSKKLKDTILYRQHHKYSDNTITQVGALRWENWYFIIMSVDSDMCLLYLSCS